MHALLWRQPAHDAHDELVAPAAQTDALAQRLRGKEYSKDCREIIFATGLNESGCSFVLDDADDKLVAPAAQTDALTQRLQGKEYPTGGGQNMSCDFGQN